MKKIFANLFSLFVLAYAAFYFWWRLSYTINFEIYWLSMACVMAEIIYFFGTALFILDTWAGSEKRKFLMPGKIVNVDVLIATYNESQSILEATITGCNFLTYPHTTYVLDDGRRPEVKALAEKMGCRYLTRDNNQHAKAGNLNAALAKTEGEFLVILDADMVPQPGLIEKALGYFTNPNVAIVQFPQEFYNLNSVQHNRKLRSSDGVWHEQSLFFHILLTGRDDKNGAFWCGSPSVLRREAIEKVGGVATQSVTEDFLTSILLNKQGMEIAYSDENVAFGLAPESLEAFFIQRFRWCKGAIEVYLSRNNPLLTAGLTWRQRLFYLSSQFHYITMFPKVFYLTLPLWLLAFDEFPIRAPFEAFLAFWLPFYFLSLSHMKLRGGKHFRYFYSEVFTLLNLFNSLHASLYGVFGWRRRKFTVTPKEVDRNETIKKDRRLLIPHALLIAALAANIYLLGAPFLDGVEEGATGETAYRLFGLFWVVLHLAISVRAIVWVTQRTYNTRHYRFPVSVPVRIFNGREELFGNTVDLNGDGAKIVFKGQLSASPWQAELFLPAGIVKADLKIHWQGGGGGRGAAGVSLVEMDEVSKKTLLHFLFVILPTKWSTLEKRFVVEAPAMPELKDNLAEAS